MEKKAWQERVAGHRQRLRDKFEERGINGLSDEEVLELLLTLATPRRDCKQEARAALAHFKTLAAVLEATPAELQQVKGIGPRNSFALRFLHGVARRYLKERLTQKNYLRSSREVADYLVHELRGLQHEVFLAIFLDAGHRVIASEIVAQGTISVNTVYPRELIKKTLQHNAAALVLAHNHPSGRIQPSQQDIELTRTLHNICAFMHINLLDHLIVGGSGKTFSFADHGIMASIRNQETPLRPAADV